MKRDLQSCTVNCVFFLRCFFRFRFIACIQIRSVSRRLSASIWVLYQGRSFLATTERKNITNLSCFKRAHNKVFVFFMFCSMGYANLSTCPKRLQTELTNITDGTFVHYPFFVLNIPLFTLLTFSYRNFFPIFVCFEIFWQLATTHATGTQIVRAKMTSLDAIFCRGNKSSSHSLARFCRRKHKKSTARTSRSWKNLSSTCRQV